MTVSTTTENPAHSVMFWLHFEAVPRGQSVFSEVKDFCCGFGNLGLLGLLPKESALFWRHVIGYSWIYPDLLPSDGQRKSPYGEPQVCLPLLLHTKWPRSDVC